MGLGHRAKHAFNAWRNALNIGRALEYRGFHAGIRNALFDVPHKHVGHKLIAAKNCSRALVMKVHGHVVVGVHACRDNDVEFGLGRDSLDTRNITSEPDDREVDYRIYASRFKLVQSRNGIGDSFLFVSPRFWKVLHDLG